MRVQFKNAQNPDTRRAADAAYDARLEINAPILDKIIALRWKIADLLGYPTWADYITEVKMAKDAKTVTDVGFSLSIPCAAHVSP